MNDQNDFRPSEKAPDNEVGGLLKQFLDIQAHGFAVQQQQIDLQRMQIEKNAEYANQALEKEYADRAEERKHAVKLQRSSQVFVGILMLMVMIFLLIALYIDKETAKELVRLIAIAMLVSASYAVGRYRATKGDEKK